jgi:hypothetical protein
VRLLDRGRFDTVPIACVDALNDDLPPGSVLDDPPRLTLAALRPYAVALLLHKGWLSVEELAATLTAHCNIEDLKVGGTDPFDGVEYDGTRLERLIEQAIDELVAQGILQHSKATQNWVPTPRGIGRFTRWAAVLNAVLPAGILMYIQQGFANVETRRLRKDLEA